MKHSRFGWRLFGACLLVLPALVCEAKNKKSENTNELRLADFLADVKAKHQDFKSAQKTKEAQELLSNEINLMFAPTLFSELRHIDDHKPSTLYQLDSSGIDSLQLGVMKQTRFGLSGRVYYSLVDQRQNNLAIAPGSGVDTHFLQASPAFELTMPLWRNFLGAESASQVAQAKAAKTAVDLEQDFRMRGILIQAETLYWQLALARETVHVSQDAYGRQERLVAWHKERSRTGLADKVDLFQSEAALQNAAISLKNAQDNEIRAAREFNLARSVNSSTVSENLVRLTNDVALKLKVPKRKGPREDLQAMQKRLEAMASTIDLIHEKYKPTLELFGGMALNNANPSETGKAISGSFKMDKPTTTIGLRFSMFLDGGITRDVKSGRLLEKQSLEESYSRRLLEQDGEWEKLVESFDQTKDKVKLFQVLEEKQREKYEYEQNRRNAGRTSTQQVLLFEFDYRQAQYGRIQTLSELLLIFTKMKLYQGAA